MKENFIPFPRGINGLPFFISLAGTSYCDGSYRITRLKSPCLCMEYIIEGEGCIMFEGKNYYPKKGDIYLLPPGKDHIYFSDSENPWTKIWFNAEGSLINGLLNAYNPSNTVLFQNVGGEEYFLKIHSCANDASLNSSQKHEKAALAVHELFQFLYDKTKTRVISSEMGILKEYIDNNITKNISLKQLSELVYLSESQIIRLFKRDFGKTPYDYILDLKIEHSKTLLKSTHLRVKEIAFNLGFSDEHYFSYIFRQKTGKNPLGYRKE